MQASKLEIFSLGVVAKNKPLDTPDIEVVPIESSPMNDGELSDNISTVESQGIDAEGKTYNLALTTTASIKATWLPLGSSNRKTAPDVRRGEMVALYRFADQDKYYWTTLLYDMKLRKLETVIFAISDTIDEAADGTAQNTYFMEWSTHRKIVHLHTSKSDSEPFAYDFQLNTKDGSFIFQDDIGNYISLDSKNVRIEMKNSSGAWLDMNKKNIRLYAPDSITLRADNNILLDAGNNITYQAGSNVTGKAGNNISMTAGSTLSETATTINTTSASTLNTVPSTKFTGNAIIVGKTTTTGMSSIAGGAPFIVNSPGTFTAPVAFTTSVTIQKLSSPSAIDAPNIK